MWGICVCVCVGGVTQLCSVFMSRADCALNESCSSLLGKEKGREEKRGKERGGGEIGRKGGEDRERALKRWKQSGRGGIKRGCAEGLEKCVCWGFFLSSPTLNQVQCGEGVKIC